MQEISWTNFKAMNLRDLKEGPCLIVTGDGEAVLWVIVGAKQAMRSRVQSIASQIDVGRGIGRGQERASASPVEGQGDSPVMVSVAPAGVQ